MTDKQQPFKMPEPPAKSEWKLVPIEPTTDMWDAAVREENRIEANWPGQRPTCFQTYKAMIEAAPSPGMPSDAYDMIDRFLRNNLDDTDYAEYSEALEAVLALRSPADQGGKDRKDAVRELVGVEVRAAAALSGVKE